MVNAFRWMIFVIGLAVVIGSIMVTSAGDPIIQITSPSSDTVYTDEITVSGSAMGTGGAVVKSVTVKGERVGGTSSWSKDISLQPGLNEITVVAEDNMGQSRTEAIKVTYNPPTPTPTTQLDRMEATDQQQHQLPTPTPTGSISITTKPSEAEIFWDGISKGDTPITLEDVIEPHRVKISKEGFKNVTSRISLYEDMPITRHFKLKPITGSIVVSSTPSGACVYLDGVDMEANTTCMLIEVVVGNHTIKLTKPDYFEVAKSVSVSDNNRTYLHVNLTGCGYINISSHPSGAKVYLDGNDTRGTTPKNNCRVAVGNHTINLTKRDYFDVIRPVAVSLGRTLSVNENLTECCSICISSNPSGANVYLDGDYMGETPLNNSKVALGNHTIKLTKSDYFDVIIKNVSVSVGEIRHLHENLTGYGSLSISSNPSGAKVYLNGNYTGETPLNIEEVVVGSYSYRLTKTYHKDVEDVINVSAGELTKIDKSLSFKDWVEWLPKFLLCLSAFVGSISAFFRWVINPRRSKKKDLLFRLDPSCRQHLKQGDVDENVKNAFEKNEEFLSSEAKVSKMAKKQWEIVDGDMEYRIEDTKKWLNIYKKRNN